MFYTFTSGPSPGDNASHRNPKRFKVSRACDYCRKHRVRCDANTPCSRCVSNNIECVLSAPGSYRIPESSQPPRSVHQNSTPVMQSCSSKRMGNVTTPAATTAVASSSGTSLNSSTSDTVVASTPASSVTSSVASTVLTADSSPSIERLDSTVGFMSRINAFCSSISHLSPDFPEESPPAYTFNVSARSPTANATRDPPSELSRVQAKQLLDLYWRRSHPLAPILDRHRLESAFETLWGADGSEQRTAPLVDAVLALTLLRLYNSGMNRRLLGFQWEQGDYSPNYFRRCHAVASQYNAFARPTLEDIQCQLLMTLYLLDNGEHQGSYIMIGLAIRSAYSLNFHQGLPETDSDSQLARRVWWTAVHLDFRCSRLVGRPFGVQLTDTTCVVPSLDNFPYHSRAIDLTRSVVLVAEAMSGHRVRTDDGHISRIEAWAATLSAEIFRLREWKDHHLRDAVKRPLYVEHKQTADWIQHVTDTSSSQLLHGLLLELQYYDAIIGLHRPFICFPNGSLIPQRSPQADVHATTALNHAMSAIDLTHRVMSTTDALFGSSEVYQWQWNALLTLVGFLLAYPLCRYAPTARHHTQLALDIFSSADPKNHMAMRAASLTRSLCTKVDSLVQILKQDAPIPAPSQPEKHILDDWDYSTVTIDPSQLNSEALWSWTDLTKPDAWSAYSDGVTGVLADFPNLPFGNETFALS